MEQTGEGMTLRVPPIGLMHPGTQATTMVIGVLATGGPLLGASCFAAFWIAGARGAEKMWPAYFLFLALLLFGLAILLGAVEVGRRRAVFSVTGGRLKMWQTGTLTGKRGEWPREQIVDIRAIPSRTSVGGEQRRIWMLQVELHDGECIKMLRGRDPQEIGWIATKLRRALRLPAGDNTSDPSA